MFTQARVDTGGHDMFTQARVDTGGHKFSSVLYSLTLFRQLIVTELLFIASLTTNSTRKYFFNIE